MDVRYLVPILLIITLGFLAQPVLGAWSIADPNDLTEPEFMVLDLLAKQDRSTVGQLQKALDKKAKELEERRWSQAVTDQPFNGQATIKVDHTYDEVGAFRAKLVVKDDQGNASTAVEQTIEVSPPDGMFENGFE